MKIPQSIVVGLLLLIGINVHAQLRTNVLNIPIFLMFDYTNTVAGGNVDGFLLFEATSASQLTNDLPGVPILGVPASTYSIPGSNFALPMFTRPITIISSPTNAVPSVSVLIYTLGSTNSTYGTNAIGFSNTATNRGAPVGGTKLRGL